MRTITAFNRYAGLRRPSDYSDILSNIYRLTCIYVHKNNIIMRFSDKHLNIDYITVNELRTIYGWQTMLSITRSCAIKLTAD